MMGGSNLLGPFAVVTSTSKRKTELSGGEKERDFLRQRTGTGLCTSIARLFKNVQGATGGRKKLVHQVADWGLGI